MSDIELVENLGDGVSVCTRWNAERAESVFLIFGDEAAVAYADCCGRPCVDLFDRECHGIDAFKRTLIVYTLAWARAERSALLMRLPTDLRVQASNVIP